MTSAARGRCGACGCNYAITARGVMRKHDSGTPLASEARYGRGSWGICAGSGLPPIDVDAPLLTERLADLERQLADLEREVRRLRHVAEAHRLDAVAARARAEGLRHLRDVNRHLLNALRSMLDNDHDAAERDAMFERDMEAIRVRHPVLDEVEEKR